MSRAPDVSWTRLSHGRYICLRCTDTHTLTLPMPIDEFAKETKAFNYLHRNCKATQGAPDGSEK